MGSAIMLPGAFGLRLVSNVDVLPPNYIELEVCARSFTDCCTITATDFQATAYKFLQNAGEMEVVKLNSSHLRKKLDFKGEGRECFRP